MTSRLSKILVLLFISGRVSSLCAAPAETAPEAVSGTVFLDANGNGRLDGGEKGLGGIRVSDGVQIVETGEDGTYTIKIAADPSVPYRPMQVVCVSWPSYKWPTTAWWRRLGDLKQGERVDFGLREDRQERSFAFLHVSDNHDSGGAYEVFGRDVKRMLPMAKFIINTGDLGYATTNGADAMFSSVAEKSKLLPIPIFHTPGNHDISPGKMGVGPDEDPLAGYGGFLKYVGPVRWSFDYAGAHFVAVDEKGPYGAWLNEDMKRVKPDTMVFGFIHYRGHFGRLTHMFYGHVHINEHKNASMTSVINLSGNGGCAVGIVQEKSFDVVDRCSGCKSDPAYHSRSRCQLSELRGFRGALQSRRGKQYDLARTLQKNTRHVVKLERAGAMELEVEVAPDGNSTGGIRIGGGTNTLAIVSTNGILSVAGVPIPYMPRAEAKAIRLHLLLENNRFTLYIDDLMHFTKGFAVDNPSEVTLFSDGASTAFKGSVWELNAGAAAPRRKH